METTEIKDQTQPIEDNSKTTLSLNFSGNKPKTLKSRLTSFITGGNFDISKSVPSANESYLTSTYGHSYSLEERLDNFLKDLCSAITNKGTTKETSKCDYACVKVIPEDLIEYKDTIISLFTEKGYTAVDLKDTVNGLAQNYIFVCWDKFDTSKGE